MQAASSTLGQDFAPRGEFFPLRKLFCRANPLQQTAFWGMIVVTALIGYGFSAKDIPIVALYALLLVFIPGFLGYLLSLGCMQLAERHDK